ncbi:MAG: binding-protein-dependent transport system inner rane component [Cyanobacteria bacterium RYN_339]|nr:binding-protein-dependent transport system inner rane component [Cyanobacteria bacterium RYN_339]
MKKFSFYVVMTLILLYTIFPYYWAIVSSIKPNSELFVTPVMYWPQHPTLENYRLVLTNPDFMMALLNSAVVCVATVTVALGIGSLAAYVLGRFAFRGRTPMLYVVLGMTMFPQIAVLGGLYTMINALGLFNKLPALVISYLLFTLPFTVWVLTNSFKGLPGELEEAAMIDGATAMQTFRIVFLPLVAPGMVTTGLLAFIQCWNEFLYALSFIQTPEKYTVTRAMFGFSGVTGSSFEIPWGQMMAATVLVTIPLIIMVLFFQKKIIAGLTGGAVKG